MDADGKALAGLGLCLVAACAFTGAVAFAQIGAGGGFNGDDAPPLDGNGTAAAADIAAEETAGTHPTAR